jgi:pimeloyl-ACP methyl ester carboxylesterase
MKKIYILHGWTYSTDTWNPLIDLLKQNGVDSTLLNVPGLTDGTDRIWTLDDYVDWLNDALKNEEKVVLVGHSNGGRISIAFAARYPEKVERLILIDSAGIYPNGLKIRIKRSVFWVLAKVGKIFSSSDRLRKLLYRLARERDYERASPSMRKTMANLISVDLRPVLASIKAPTLLIWGANDGSTPLRDGELMHRSIERSTLVVIPDARHSPHATHAEIVAKQIIAELA